MDQQEKFDYWLDIAEYDLETAEAMLSSRRWLYVVFMCQQSIEKLVKGLYTLYVCDEIPRTHNISYLLHKFEDQLKEPVTNSRYDLFEKLRIYYIEGRYTDYKQKLSKSVDEQTARSLMKETGEAFKWLLSMKK